MSSAAHCLCCRFVHLLGKSDIRWLYSICVLQNIGERQSVQVFHHVLLNGHFGMLASNYGIDQD